MGFVLLSSFGPFGREDENVRAFHAVERLIVSQGMAFRSELTERLCDWWSGFQPDLPQRSAFDILDHPRLAPYLFLYRFNAPDEIEYRLNGEAVVRAIGRTQAGNIISPDHADGENAALAAYLMEVAESRQAHCCRGTLAFVDKKHLRFESVDCPLAGPDGTVSHIVGLLVPELDGAGR